MLTPIQAADMDTFISHLETAIAASPETAHDAGTIYIAHSIELPGGLEGAVFSYGHQEYTRDDHSRSIAEFYGALLEEGKIGRPGEFERVAMHALTGNPANDIIQIAGALHRRELEAKAQKKVVQP